MNMKISISFGEAIVIIILSFFVGLSATWGSNIADKYFDWSPVLQSAYDIEDSKKESQK